MQIHERTDVLGEFARNRVKEREKKAAERE